jgi:hypothetical protein
VRVAAPPAPLGTALLRSLAERGHHGLNVGAPLKNF